MKNLLIVGVFIHMGPCIIFSCCIDHLCTYFIHSRCSGDLLNQLLCGPIDVLPVQSVFRRAASI